MNNVTAARLMAGYSSSHLLPPLAHSFIKYVFLIKFYTGFVNKICAIRLPIVMRSQIRLVMPEWLYRASMISRGGYEGQVLERKYSLRKELKGEVESICKYKSCDFDKFIKLLCLPLHKAHPPHFPPSFHYSV